MLVLGHSLPESFDEEHLDREDRLERTERTNPRIGAPRLVKSLTKSLVKSNDKMEPSPDRVKKTESERVEGSIRMIRPDRGFLFIAGDDGQDHFAHWSGFEKTSKGFRSAEIQDRVSFISVEGPKGPRAIQIRFLE
jgi:CspA family cold shock protein